MPNTSTTPKTTTLRYRYPASISIDSPLIQLVGRWKRFVTRTPGHGGRSAALPRGAPDARPAPERGDRRAADAHSGLLVLGALGRPGVGAPKSIRLKATPKPSETRISRLSRLVLCAEASAHSLDGLIHWRCWSALAVAYRTEYFIVFLCGSSIYSMHSRCF